MDVLSGHYHLDYLWRLGWLGCQPDHGAEGQQGCLLNTAVGVTGAVIGGWILNLIGGSGVAMLFPNEASCLRLVTAVVMAISDAWQTGRTYIWLDDLYFLTFR